MIAVIDYGIGNVRSVMNALEHLGAKAVLTRDHALLSEADGLILPGVGAFGEGMKRLAGHNLKDHLVKLVQSGKPILGICLGFQMLMAKSTELGDHAGLNLVDCECVRLPVDARLPHIGWSKVTVDTSSSGDTRLLRDVNGAHFYFVHSYGVVNRRTGATTGLARYGDCDIIASLESGNVFGTQFHPEKSGPAGLKLLQNYLAICK